MTFEMDTDDQPTHIIQTRMWMVNTEWMCNRHLEEEHVSIHVFVRSLKNKQVIQGFIDRGLVEIHNLWARHEELVEEMIRRGIEHNTGMPWCSHLIKGGWISQEISERDLMRECDVCRERYDFLAEQTEKLLTRDL